jgi:hypothetical protein
MMLLLTAVNTNSKVCALFKPAARLAVAAVMVAAWMAP